jgi:hypothetical protein
MGDSSYIISNILLIPVFGVARIWRLCVVRLRRRLNYFSRNAKVSYSIRLRAEVAQLVEQSIRKRFLPEREIAANQ